MASTSSVLVTGSSGHLGTALMLALPDMGFTPVGIDIIPSPHTTVLGSINDRTLIRRLLTENDIRFVVHTATLHKPHVESHTRQDFVDTNISGTLSILEEVRALGSQVEGVIFLSSTTTFGAALSPGPDKPAVWIDEQVIPIPKNIYGVTKVAAEDLCHLFHRQTGIPTLVLRTSRFFPEQDDDEDRRNAMGDDNLKVVELVYRRCDIEDIVRAVACAMRKAREVRWGKYIISAPTPFKNDAETLRILNSDSRGAFVAAVPGCDTMFAKRGWKFPQRVDRVYDSSKAVRELGWKPVYTFERALQLLEEGKPFRSALTERVGKRGYHSTNTGVYTVRSV
ncbi:hypothetical protein ANO11243_092090 [Dothideomycetidae sp. 11243]|nr:hypothetical protein ANO11243_092090 [fungal sp. No.11243]